MRIAAINMTHVGSTGKIMLNVAEEARQVGHEAWTFSPRNYQRRGKMEAPHIEHHMYFGSSVENMFNNYFSKMTGFQGFLSWRGTHQLLKELDLIQPDIIHLHNLHNRTICLPTLFQYIKRRNLSVVWTLHDCWAFTGQCPYFTMVKCDRWKTGCHHCPQIYTYPEAMMDMTKLMWKQKKKWFTGIKDMTLVTPSQWLADLVKQSFLKDYPVKVINNGIDLQIFKPTESDFRQRYGLEDKKILLGVAFGWGKRKGLDVFIELAKQLNDEYRIVLVGTDDRVDEQLPRNIISIHRTNNQHELAEIYTTADLFVNPTREEVLGMVNVEALACGTPVVTFKTGGSPECIDETCGSVVECDDIDSLKIEIQRICSEKPFSGEDCIAHAHAFDGTNKFEEYVKLYEDSTYSTCSTI